AEFHAARRCVGQQPLLEARHYFAGSRDNPIRNDRGARRAGIRIRDRHGLPAPCDRSRGSGELSAFGALLRSNRNYRFTWSGQVVSEVGDHFNNIAVMSLAMQHTNPGLVVTGVFLSRAVPMLAAGPIAGGLLR